MDWVYYLILLCVLVAGLLLNTMTLPGLWVMVLGTGAYAWLTDFSYAGTWTLIVMVVLGLIAELIEFVAGGAGAKGAGGTIWGFVGALVGSLIGGIAFGGVIPVIGVIFGVCIGAAIGAFTVEYLIDPDAGKSWRIGVGAFKGRLLGIIIKLGFGIVLFLIAAIACWPWGGRLVTSVPTVGSPIPATMPVED